MLVDPKQRAFLVNGAKQLGVTKIVAQAMNDLLLKEDSSLISLLLRLLGTSVGCFLITGYPMAFQELPLAKREEALRRMRDSCIPDVSI